MSVTQPADSTVTSLQFSAILPKRCTLLLDVYELPLLFDGLGHHALAVTSSAGRMIGAAEIISKVQPMISASHVYGVLAEMRETKEVKKFGRRYRYMGEPKKGVEQAGAVQ